MSSLKTPPTKKVFDELDGIFQAQVLVIRRANLERRVLLSALQKIASGMKHAQDIAMDALLTVDRLRDTSPTEKDQLLKS